MASKHLPLLWVGAACLLILCSGCEPLDGDSWNDNKTVFESPPADLLTPAAINGPLPPSIPLPLYSPDSPWNTPINQNPAIDPDSDALIARLLDDITPHGGVTLSVYEYAYPVYVATESTPRQDVILTAGWSPFSALLDAPIPMGARPDPGTDAHLIVIDLSTGYEYDFWQMSQNNDGTWSASWGNRIALDSNGWYATGMSARGSGSAALAGVIWPDEFAQGHIGHALQVAIPAVRAGGPVLPATESDGTFRQDNTLPEGARLQLDPSLDLDLYDLTPYERMIAEALQTYGAIVGDSSGGDVDLYAINPISYPENPYPADWFQERWTVLAKIPWESLRVLEMGDQVDNTGDTYVADESIYRP